MGKQITKSLMLGALAGALVLTAKPEMVVADTKTDSIVISKSKVKMTVGNEITIGASESDDITVNVYTSNTNKEFKISTKDGKKVKIRKSGKVYKVKSIKSGKVNIKLTLSANKKVSKTLKLNIRKKSVADFGEVVKVTGKNFDKEVLQAKGIVIVDFTTKWCGYCQFLDPLYKEAAKIRQIYKFTKVDGDEDRDLVKKQGIEGFPTLHLYKNGKLIREGGYWTDMTVWDLLDWIELR